MVLGEMAKILKKKKKRKKKREKKAQIYIILFLLREHSQFHTEAIMSDSQRSRIHHKLQLFMTLCDMQSSSGNYSMRHRVPIMFLLLLIH